jgi:hypothetical protein
MVYLDFVMLRTVMITKTIMFKAIFIDIVGVGSFMLICFDTSLVMGFFFDASEVVG